MTEAFGLTESIESFNTFAASYQERFGAYKPYLETYAAFYQYFEPEQTALLDIACGPANISVYFSNQRPELKITGTDLSENMLRLAQENLPQGDFKALDTRQIAVLDQTFDIVVCGFGLPYLSHREASQLIVDIRQLLNPGGLLYLSTMEGEDFCTEQKVTPAGGRYEIHYHSFDFLKGTLESQGFQLLKTIRQDFTLGDSTLRDLFLMARLGV